MTIWKKWNDLKNNKKIIPLIVIISIILIILVSKFLIKQEPIKKLEISVLENRTEELVFSFSIDDFVESYNSTWKKDNKTAYLAKSAEWRTTVYDKAIHSNHETYYYNFIEDEKNLLLPTFTVYVPSDSNYVQEITINFDHHSYTDEMYELYEDMCFHTLKVFFPDLKDKKLIKLCEKLNELANEHIFPNEQKLENNPIPYTLYYRDGVGVYPYFAIGDSLRMCILPVTEQSIQEFREKGTIIHKM